jgi:hypothetical protein
MEKLKYIFIINKYVYYKKVRLHSAPGHYSLYL